MGTCFWVCAAAALRVGVAATCPALQLCSSCGRSPLGGGGHPLCSPSTKVSLWNSAKPSPLAEVLCAAPGPARTVLPALGFWCSHGEVPSHHSAPFLTPPPRPRTPPPLQRDPRAELTRCHQGEGGGQCHGHWSGTAECRTAPLCREWAPGTFNHRSRFPDSHTAETAINLCNQTAGGGDERAPGPLSALLLSRGLRLRNEGKNHIWFCCQQGAPSPSAGVQCGTQRAATTARKTATAKPSASHGDLRTGPGASPGGHGAFRKLWLEWDGSKHEAERTRAQETSERHGRWDGDATHGGCSERAELSVAEQNCGQELLGPLHLLLLFLLLLRGCRAVPMAVALWGSCRTGRAVPAPRDPAVCHQPRGQGQSCATCHQRAAPTAPLPFPGQDTQSSSRTPVLRDASAEHSGTGAVTTPVPTVHHGRGCRAPSALPPEAAAPGAERCQEASPRAPCSCRAAAVCCMQPITAPAAPSMGARGAGFAERLLSLQASSRGVHL
ncbi:uncharacterized protein LOC110390712 isoform X2 [Numida meleagris]|uniref:uncharacterized protein LOC110390712 isoform X2 n=1 Tax=Numida meleagris TaxID=8996 RepID=UPI000B3DB4F2|nr:uncharacterized protein LOC110390712 isoform X2 [Numida meleagris]